MDGAMNPGQRADSDVFATAQTRNPRPPIFDALSPDPTSSSLTIWACVKDGEAKYIGAKCLLDSGCNDNWISLEVLKRGGIETHMEKLPRGDHKYVGFDGNACFPLGKVTIRSFMKIAATARETTFLVAENGPFDVVLGKKFIISANVITVDQTALPLRGPLFLLVGLPLIIIMSLTD